MSPQATPQVLPTQPAVEHPVHFGGLVHWLKISRGEDLHAHYPCPNLRSDMSVQLLKHVDSSQAGELPGMVCLSNLHTTAIPTQHIERVPAAAGDHHTALADVFGQLHHNHGHNPLKSGQGEEQQDICTMLPPPEHVLLQIVFKRRMIHTLYQSVISMMALGQWIVV